jgi:hypothetical protein
MQVKHWLIAAVAIASALPCVAKAATTDPYIVVYRASGVTDDGNGFVATVVFCTNLSPVAENVAFILRKADGSSAYFNTVTLNSTQTYTVGTRAASTFVLSANAATGAIQQGFLSIGSTTMSITCSAMVVNPTTTPPSGMSLHMQRYNPAPNTMD